MKTEQLLEKYMQHHPEYWEFENELAEVQRLKSLIQKERALTHIHHRKSNQFESRLSISV